MCQRSRCHFSGGADQQGMISSRKMSKYELPSIYCRCLIQVSCTENWSGAKTQVREALYRSWGLVRRVRVQCCSVRRSNFPSSGFRCQYQNSILFFVRPRAQTLKMYVFHRPNALAWIDQWVLTSNIFFVVFILKANAAHLAWFVLWAFLQINFLNERS